MRHDGVLRWQVLEEYYVTATRSSALPATHVTVVDPFAHDPGEVLSG